MKPLSRDQRLSLAEFSGNFAVAWLTGGIIAPFFSNQVSPLSLGRTLLAILWAVSLIITMLYLTKGGRK